MIIMPSARFDRNALIYFNSLVKSCSELQSISMKSYLKRVSSIPVANSAYNGFELSGMINPMVLVLFLRKLPAMWSG